MFCRHWGYGPEREDQMGLQDVVWVKLDNIKNTLRIANVHYITLKHGETYKSPVYILTPHKGGWVNGISPYKEWVDRNKKRAVPVPSLAREMLGFRTIWATEQYPDDPDASIWSYDDYPIIADDMVEHGLFSLNVWGLFEWILPLDESRFHRLQGGIEALRRNIEKLKEKGVQIEAFVSWLSLWEKMRERYGYPKNDGTRAGWAENLKGIPTFLTPYMERYCCALLQDHNNELWIKDVKEGLRFLRDVVGIQSISWDQYLLDKWVLYEIIDEYRKETYELFPEATFSGESTYFFEADIDHLDYTWVWIYRNNDEGQDTAPYSHVVETTRPQMNIDADPLYVKYCFMDNVMINAYPSKPDNVNGSALIKDYPELSKAYKQCAKMRKNYLDYFTKGKILGDCVLSERCKQARITGYVHNVGILIFAVKRNDATAEIRYDVSQFVSSDEFTVYLRDADNTLLSCYESKSKGSVTLSGHEGELFVINLLPAK